MSSPRLRNAATRNEVLSEVLISRVGLVFGWYNAVPSRHRSAIVGACAFVGPVAGGR